MRKRKLGALEESEFGSGILSFTSTYGQAPERPTARDLGITLFDTAEVSTLFLCALPQPRGQTLSGSSAFVVTFDVPSATLSSLSIERGNGGSQVTTYG
jgi:hypothetical protein